MQRVVQLPMAIEIDNKEEDSIVRLSMKVLISVIFKG